MLHLVLSYLNGISTDGTGGALFDKPADKAAVITYTDRICNFFRNLLANCISKIFMLFEIEADFNSYVEALVMAVTGKGRCRDAKLE